MTPTVARNAEVSYITNRDVRIVPTQFSFFAGSPVIRLKDKNSGEYERTSDPRHRDGIQVGGARARRSD